MYQDGAAGDVTQNQAEKALVDKVMRKWQSAQAERTQWTSLWQLMADYVRPSRQVTSKTDTPQLTGFENLFDGTAISACMTLASGCMSRLTPAQVPWFSFEAPRALKGSDDAKKWFAECTEIAIEALASSNFYTQIHELYLDRGAFGTGLIHCESSERHPLNFKTSVIGSYALCNGSDGMVDTVYRELEYTARQAEQEYGLESLPESIRRELATDAEPTKKHKFLHCIYPRAEADRDAGKIGPENKPVASVHIFVQEKRIVRNSGYDEMPSFGTRYLEWGGSAYGICPTWQALPDARQVNELQKNMDVLAEIAAFPRFLAPFDQEGEVDLRSSGMTYFKDPQNIPRVWGTEGRYDVGKDRVLERQKAIKDAFHVELFQMWSAITKQMTAFEASERAQEKIELFSPTFTLLSTELYGPLLRRVFALLLRQSVFPMPPEDSVYQNARGAWAVPDPDIRYTSRLALALKAVQNGALNRTLGTFAPFIEAKPELLDNLNLDLAMRDIGRSEGLKEDWIVGEDEVAQMRQARAQAQAAQAQAEQQNVQADSQKMQAEAAAKLASIPKQGAA